MQHQEIFGCYGFVSKNEVLSCGAIIKTGIAILKKIDDVIPQNNFFYLKFISMFQLICRH